MATGNITPNTISGTPVGISIYSVTQERNHYHDGFMEIIYCFKGNAVLHQNYEDIVLEEGDIISCDPHDVHCLRSSEENLFVSFFFDLNDPIFNNPDLPYAFFVCERYVLRSEKQNEIQNLKHFLLTLLYFYCFPHPKVSQTETFRNLSVKIIDMMIEHFHFFDYTINELDYSSEIKKRFDRLVIYINRNYKEKLTISKLSELEHLNTSYLSSLLRKTSYFGFSGLINFIRIYNSGRMLLDSSKNISEISMDVGYSDSKFFYRYFKQWYGHTPLQHRKYYQETLLKSQENKYYQPEEITTVLEHYISYYFATLHIPEFWNVPYIPYRNVPEKVRRTYIKSSKKTNPAQ